MQLQVREMIHEQYQKVHTEQERNRATIQQNRRDCGSQWLSKIVKVGSKKHSLPEFLLLSPLRAVADFNPIGSYKVEDISATGRHLKESVRGKDVTISRKLHRCPQPVGHTSRTALPFSPPPNHCKACSKWPPCPHPGHQTNMPLTG